MVGSSDTDSDFDIFTGVLLEDTSALHFFILHSTYIINWFPIKKKVESISSEIMANNISLLANAPSQVKFSRHCLEQMERGIDLSVKANKTEYMFKPNVVIPL